MASPPSPSRDAKRLKMSSSTSDVDPDPSSPAAASEPRRRYKRRKVAILLAYCGAGYQGMQKNPGARTIEGDLEEALFLAGAVPDADRGAPRRYDWARAARTDKGVSAVAQVVSGRFYVDPPGLVARLNAHLSDQIRIFGYKRVTNSFNAKKFCDRRRYVYLLPVFALDPSAHPHREAVIASLGTGNELARCVECSERGRKMPGILSREPRDSNKGAKSDLGCCKGGGAEDGASLDSVALVLTDEDRNEVGNGELNANKVEQPDVVDGVANKMDDDTSIVNTECRVLAPEDRCEIAKGESTSQTGEVFDVKLNPSTIGEVGSMEKQHGNLEPVESGKRGKNPVEEDNAAVGEGEGTNSGEAPSRRHPFSYGNEERERLSRILKYYVGTHNFHNFTTRTKAEDPSARRYIISFNADTIVSIDGIEFVKCEVVGQSFMLHQIRKMIGMAVAMMRNCAPELLMDIAFQKDVNINVPTAPEVGLYLDECLFSSYNQKWKDSHEVLSIEAYTEEAEEFRMNRIHSHIAAMEHKEGAVALWLHSLNHRNYPDFDLTNTEKVKRQIES